MSYYLFPPGVEYLSLYRYILHIHILVYEAKIIYIFFLNFLKAATNLVKTFVCG